MQLLEERISGVFYWRSSDFFTGRKPHWVATFDRELCSATGRTAHVHPSFGHRGMLSSWFYSFTNDFLNVGKNEVNPINSLEAAKARLELVKCTGSCSRHFCCGYWWVVLCLCIHHWWNEHVLQVESLCCCISLFYAFTLSAQKWPRHYDDFNILTVSVRSLLPRFYF